MKDFLMLMLGSGIRMATAAAGTYMLTHGVTQTQSDQIIGASLLGITALAHAFKNNKVVLPPKLIAG